MEIKQLSNNKSIDLNDSALRFMASNAADLMKNDNMNAAFLDEYKAVVAHYNALRQTYTDSKKAAKDLRVDNTIANNNVHKKMMKMFADAKILFRREPDLRSQFTFDSILAQVRRIY